MMPLLGTMICLFETTYYMFPVLILDSKSLQRHYDMAMAGKFGVYKT